MPTTIVTLAMPAVHAARAFWTALSGIPGVRSATVQLGHAEIEHDGVLSRAALDEAAALAGCRVLSVRAERRLPALGEAPPEP